MKKISILFFSLVSLLILGCTASVDPDRQVKITGPIQYTISYNSNNRSGIVTTQKGYRGSTVKLDLNTFVYPEHTFIKWSTNQNTSSNDNKYYENGDDYYLMRDAELFAVWKPHNYKFHFNFNNEEQENLGTEMEYYTLDANLGGKLPRCSYSIFEMGFRGWAIDPETEEIVYKDGEIFAPNQLEDTDELQEIELYAIWAPADYHLTYMANGGNGSMMNQAFFENESQLLRPNEFTKENHVFKGWTTIADTEVDGEIVYTEEQEIIITEDTVLYAVWSKMMTKIVYNSCNGEGTMEDQTFFFSNGVTVKENEFTRDKYEFICWNTEADESGTEYQVGDSIVLTEYTETVTLYAIWNRIWEITFDSNNSDATGTMEIQKAPAKKVCILSANKFSLSHYTIVKWNTKPDGTGTDYPLGDAIVPESDLTLYAVWKPDNYSITYVLNKPSLETSTSGSTTSNSMDYPKKITVKPSGFTCEHYTFTRWNTKADGTGTYYYDTEEIKLQNNITLYAQWYPKTYKITLHSNADSYKHAESHGNLEDETRTIEYEYGDEVILTNKFVLKDNYHTIERGTKISNPVTFTFQNWQTEKSAVLRGTSYENSYYMKNCTLGNKDLYARWISDGYYIIYKTTYKNSNSDGNARTGDQISFKTGSVNATSGLSISYSPRLSDASFKYDEKHLLIGYSDESEYTCVKYNRNKHKLTGDTSIGNVTVYNYKPIVLYDVLYTWDAGEISSADTYNGASIPKSEFSRFEETEENYYKITGDINYGMASQYPIEVNSLKALKYIDTLNVYLGYDPVYTVKDRDSSSYSKTIISGVSSELFRTGSKFIECNRTQAGSFRLPDEAEWKYITTLYNPIESYSLDNMWYSGNSGGKKHKVGTEGSGNNFYSTHDLLGNVSEWVHYYNAGEDENYPRACNGNDRKFYHIGSDYKTSATYARDITLQGVAIVTGGADTIFGFRLFRTK